MSRTNVASDSIGPEMHALMAELYPICRSITGNGFRQSLAVLKRRVPIEVREVASGTTVFDWVVPKEWNIRDAYVKNSRGDRVIDFQRSNLHVLNYSIPVNEKMTLAALKPHLYSLPDHPDWIPYRTSYYEARWGFCVSHNQLLGLADGEYEVCIDSTLADGALTYGELYLPGQTEAEVLISCHCCHPSLANDNLSGAALATFLADQLSRWTRRYSYRFVFVPVTIGSITWLSVNQKALGNIQHGLVLSCVGDAGPITYKKSQRGSAEIDRVVAHVLSHSGQPHRIVDFTPYGYDERQYCSPGINLPVGCFMRTPNGQYPEYHTSADNLDFVKPDRLADSLATCLAVLDVLERNKTYVNRYPNGEPQLGRRGLYQSIGGHGDARQFELAMLWVLNQSDGSRSLLDIAERSGIAFNLIRQAADALAEKGLLRE